MKPEVTANDPNVKIPAAVKAASLSADEMHKAAYPPSGDPPPADPPADPLVNPPVGDPPQPEPAPVLQVTSKGNPPAENWEHMYKSMKGRVDAQAAQLSSAGEQISNMQGLIATMQTKPPVAIPAEVIHDRLITAQETTDYGPELLDVVARKAREELSPEVVALKNELAETNSKLSRLANQTAGDARSRMETSLDQQMPEWRNVNFEPKFLHWLALPDLYSGAIRHDLLKAAYGRNNAAQVLAFFQGFLAEEAAQDPPNNGPEPSLVPKPTKVPLETFAAPGRAKSAAEIPAEKPVITRDQISRFYIDVAAGKYRGRQVEKDRAEQLIFEAQREGRIS